MKHSSELKSRTTETYTQGHPPERLDEEVILRQGQAKERLQLFSITVVAGDAGQHGEFICTRAITLGCIGAPVCQGINKPAE